MLCVAGEEAEAVRAGAAQLTVGGRLVFELWCHKAFPQGLAQLICIVFPDVIHMHDQERSSNPEKF
jgi:hypothetical protein